MFLPVRILGTGAFVPAMRVSADELDRRLGVASGTAFERNGVATRYFAEAGETSSCLAAKAIEEALAAAGKSAKELDAVLFACVLPEQPMPSTAILIHQRLGGRAEGVTCFDVNASCNGFLKLFEVAASGIAAGLWRCVAIAAAEVASKGLNWGDIDTCTLFGDGAAAAIFGPGEGNSGILAARSSTLSEGAGLCTVAAGGTRLNFRTPPPSDESYLFAMQGRSLLRLIQHHFPAFLDDLLRGGATKLVIPHQASAVGLAFLAKQLRGYGLPHVDILSAYGNQVTASLPTALHHAITSGALQRGDETLLVGTAAGVTMSGLRLRY